MNCATVYVALGSNLGDRQANLAAAYERLVEQIGCDRHGTDASSGPHQRHEPQRAGEPDRNRARISPVYETEPVGGPTGQASFLNAVAELITELEPGEVLAACQRIERKLGRPERSQRQPWGPRVIDLDLLLYGVLVIDEPGLRVPHPRMHKRWFVLKPLADLAPELVHPVLGQTVRQMLTAVERERERPAR